jgi:FdhD protein
MSLDEHKPVPDPGEASGGGHQGLRSVTVFDGGPRPRAQQAASEDSERLDWLAEERPVALVFNGVTQAVMMCSPLDLEDLALGFGLSEGLLAHPSELLDTGIQSAADGFTVDLTVTAACEWRIKSRRRTMAGRTGCGLCGLDSLQQVQLNWPMAPATAVAPQAIALALRDLGQHQTLQQRTGATHAAALCNAQGELLAVREDVGRHNALDKLIGAIHHQRLGVQGAFVCVTSRASFEMVQKALAAGVGVLVAVSAPTAMAVEVAQAHGLALAGFARGDAFVAYTYPERLGLAHQAAGSTR